MQGALTIASRVDSLQFSRQPEPGQSRDTATD